MIKNYRILMCYIIINIIVEHLLYTCSFNFHTVMKTDTMMSISQIEEWKPKD